MPAPKRKGHRKGPCGNNARARSSAAIGLFYSGPGLDLESVREAHARIVVRGALGERAARGVAAKLARFRACDRQPFAAEVDRPEKPDARKQGSASRIKCREPRRRRLLLRDAVEGLGRLRVRPCRL